MTETHKDSDGALICSDCGQVLVWNQSKAGKWYLADGKKGYRNASTRFEHITEVFTEVQNPKYAISHSKTCRKQSA